MQETNFEFVPILPMWLTIVVVTAIALFCLYGLIRSIRGSIVRAVAGGLVAASLFNPVVLQEDRTPIKTIVPVVIDQTTSQRLSDRTAQTEEIVEAIRGQFENLDSFELREITVSDNFSTTTDVSSALFSALNSALQDIPSDQVGSSIFITDGQVHDAPANPANADLPGPLHVLLTGEENEKDRLIALVNAPRFGVVGESTEIVYRVEQTGFGGSAPVNVTISIDGEEQTIDQVLPGEESSFVFDVPHGGKNIIEFKADTEDGEITEVNNQVFTTVNGIRENLRVLLISGAPHAGERTWRNLLKSDASVDLVHFTILRPPEKQDGTPINQLSLIAFPTRELFVQKIDEFDLIIFDRYERRGILPVLYFDNIARYVQDGGAVLIAAGPEFAAQNSIASTPLDQILPAVANGQINEGPFKPFISDTGKKHPVTRDLFGWDEDNPDWSRWFRHILVDQATTDGDRLMETPDGDPLLLLQRHQEGRAALFLSDHVWLWSRNFEGGGPHTQLLRRLAHWLMKEPELEEERLTAEAVSNRLLITRQTTGIKPDAVEVTTPSGNVTQLEFEQSSPGEWQVEMVTDEIGLYRTRNAELTALAQVGPANPRELTAVISTPQVLQPVSTASNGAVVKVASEGIPRLISVSPRSTSNGKGWMGLVHKQSSVLNGVFRFSMFTGLLGLALLLLGISAMWLREGR